MKTQKIRKNDVKMDVKASKVKKACIMLASATLLCSAVFVSTSASAAENSVQGVQTNLAAKLTATLHKDTKQQDAEEKEDLRNAKKVINKKHSGNDFAVNNSTQMDSALPAKYDQRDDGLVTPVKYQNPWGTCWCFGATSATETSIIGMENSKYTASTLDLSESLPAYFANGHIPAKGEPGYDPENTQAGEGMHCDQLDQLPKSAILSFGGLRDSYLNAMLMGSGATFESKYPYRGKKGLVCAKNINNPSDRRYDMTYDQAVAAGYQPMFYSQEDDWSIPESQRKSQDFIVNQMESLPDLCPKYDPQTQTYNLNYDGINSIKGLLHNKQGVNFCFCADVSTPNKELAEDESRYISKDWCHYTFPSSEAPADPVSSNHAVAVVGWDDNFSADNFTRANPAMWDDQGFAIKMLPTDAGELKNTADGKPVYTKIFSDGKSKVYYFDPTNALDASLLLDTEKLDENQNKIYTFDQSVGVLINSQHGKPLYPVLDVEQEIADPSFLTTLRDEYTYKPQGNGAWICKNSWGAASQTFPNHSDWGNDGYFYISYYDMSLCEAASYKFEEVTDRNKDEVSFHYDNIVEVPFEEATSQWPASLNAMANIYKTKQDTEVYDVAFQTEYAQTSAKAEVYYLKEGYTSPTDGKLVAEVSENFDLAGYHRMKLPNEVKVKNGGSFAVVVKLTRATSDGQKPYVFARCGINKHCLIYPAVGFYQEAVVNRGESFCFDSATNTWTDWKDFTNNRDYCMCSFSYDNCAVSAFGRPAVFTAEDFPEDQPDQPVSPEEPQDNNATNDNVSDGKVTDSNITNADYPTNGASSTGQQQKKKTSFAGYNTPATGDFDMVVILVVLTVVTAGAIGVCAYRKKGNK